MPLHFGPYPSLLSSETIQRHPQTVLTGSSESLGIEARTIEQTMEVLPRGARRLAAQLRTSASFKSLWSILTNYDQLSEFIPNLESSEVLSRDVDTVYLKQVGSQDFFGLKFSAEVFLELIEQKDKGILRFNLIKGDFRKFEGAWNISSLPGGGGSSLVYELTVQGCLGMPVSLIEKRLRKDLTSNLLSVEKEALKG